MASSIHHHQWSSTDETLKMLSDVIRLDEEFIALYERHYHELKENIKALRRLMSTFEKEFREYTEGARDGGIVGIAGGVTTIAGLALAPFTMGTSAVVIGVGSVMALGGGVGSGLLNFIKMCDQRKFIENVKNELEEFQNKINPMTKILNDICENYDFSGLIKCAAVASGILRILRIDDIGEVAVQASKTVRLTTALTGVLAGISLVLDILSVIEDNKTLDDLDRLVRNRQISESGMESKAGKFIVEMRKVINHQQDTLDALKKTKDKLAGRRDLIKEKIARRRDLIRAQALCNKDPVETTVSIRARESIREQVSIRDQESIMVIAPLGIAVCFLLLLLLLFFSFTLKL